MKQARRRFAPIVIGMLWNPDRHQIGISDRLRWNTQFSEEQMIGAGKQMEAGRSAKEVARELGITDQTLYNWRTKYSGLDVNEARRLKELEESPGARGDPARLWALPSVPRPR